MALGGEAAAYPAQLNSVLANAALTAASLQPHRNHYPSVFAWYTLNHKSQLVARDFSTPTQRDKLPKHHQVHVWTQVALAHSREEQAWRDRHPDEKVPPVQWCGGAVLDWSLLTDQYLHSRGAVNLGDWAWAFNPTDRTRPPVSVASADVFHIYNLRLSYLHSPPRTFDLERVHAPIKPDGTSWADLLDPTIGGVPAADEHVVSRILDARDARGHASVSTAHVGSATRERTFQRGVPFRHERL